MDPLIIIAILALLIALPSIIGLTLELLIVILAVIMKAILGVVALIIAGATGVYDWTKRLLTKQEA